MEFYDFPYIGNVIIPTDEVIFFQRARAKNHQPDIGWLNWDMLRIVAVFLSLDLW
jgi:hypothetical protein